MCFQRSFVAGLALCVVSSFAHAQATYPDKPIRMIIPLAAGSAVDVAARIVTQKMSDNMGQQFVIMNQPGAAGVIGAEQVAKADPDGYTIGGFNDSIMTMVPNLLPKPRWDIVKDFEPVSLVATVEWGLIANPKSGFKTAADLIAAAKAAPGKIDYGSGGVGSPQHLAMAMFAANAGITLTHVPYRGATQAAVDVAGGQIPVAFQGLGTVTALVQGDQVQLIGVPSNAWRNIPMFPPSRNPACPASCSIPGSQSWPRPARQRRSSPSSTRKWSRRSPIPPPASVSTSRAWWCAALRRKNCACSPRINWRNTAS
jgi:tripartite-type tricarboxylate transporter receptor subunit TctC